MIPAVAARTTLLRPDFHHLAQWIALHAPFPHPAQADRTQVECNVTANSAADSNESSSSRKF
jgi:hypothetical protein